MRANRGFTLLELMVVVAVAAILAGLVVWQGRSARQGADLAGGAYALAIRIGELKGRALADGREYVLVVADSPDPNGCQHQRTRCGRIVVLRNPVDGFSIAGFDPEPPIAGAEWFDDGGDEFLPRNSRFDFGAIASAWRPPAPFAAVLAWDGAIRATCAGGQDCFGLRFRPDGEILPLFPGAEAQRAGFAFVLGPVDPPSAAAERRGIFVSFPTGIVKTAAF
jgi:prepilin-type N-terminal cleavage/methylation domain-containing protein